MKKRIAALLVVLLMVLSPLAVMAETAKDETVYINLNNDGSVSEIKVVNHVYGAGSSEYFIDYGKYTDMKVLSENKPPIINGDTVKWQQDQYKDKDLYYEGTVDKEPPIKIGIKYYLDGKEVKAEELAGENGHLKVVINVKYISDKNGKVPGLMTQIQFPVSMEIFKNIKVKGGSKVIIGSMANIVFTSLPGDSQSFEAEMDGKDIELKSISISAVPAKFSLPASVTEGLNKLTGGLAEMENSASKLEGGMDNAISGTKSLKTGMDSMGRGLSSLYEGSNRIYKESQKITAGMDEFNNGLSQIADNSGKMIEGIGGASQGLDKLYAGSQENYKGVQKLYEGSKSLSKGTDELSKGISQLKEGHSQLAALAQELLKSTDPRVRGMAQGIIEEGKALDALNSGAAELNSGAKQQEGGMGQLYTGLGEYNKGFSQVQTGMKEISEGAKQFPTYLGTMNKNYEELKNGTNAVFKGYGDINAAIGEINKNVSVLPGSIQRLVDGQISIKNGLNRLNNEGIKRIRVSMDDNLEKLIGGNDKKNSYTSFMDNERNKNSTVQFVMQTPPIAKKEVKKTEAVQEEKKGFFERLMALFKRD